MAFKFNDVNLPLDERVDDLLSRLTLDEKLNMITVKHQAIDRLGIKAFQIGGEAAHGIVDRVRAETTVFPQTLGLSSTFNEQTVREAGECVGDEARGYYDLLDRATGLMMWSPTVDLLRDPRWGRTEEGYGEDPYLGAKLSTQYIKGLQGEDEFYFKMVAAPKHFYANNNEEDRYRDSSSLDPRNRFEYYLVPFEAAFKEAHAGSMMTSYNGINGIPAMQSPEINGIVRDKFGFDGFVVCDGEALKATTCMYKYNTNFAQSIADALKHGCDCMNEMPELVMDSLYEALQCGYLTEEDIDTVVRRTLKIRFRVGHFDGEVRDPYDGITKDIISCQKHKDATLKATKESLVLLKNTGILPIDKNVKSVAVIGPTADQLYKDWYTGKAPYSVTPLDGIISKIGKDKVKFCLGMDKVAFKSCKNGKYLTPEKDENNLLYAKADKVTDKETFIHRDWGYNVNTLQNVANGLYMTGNGIIRAGNDNCYNWFVDENFAFYGDADKMEIKNCYGKNVWLNENGAAVASTNVDFFERVVVEDGIKEAVELAKNSDVVILSVGIMPMLNGRELFDRPGIDLPEYQQKLIKEVYKVNKNVVLLTVSGYPFALNWENSNLPAILFATHGAQELGTAVADVLFGDYSPAGRTSITWYKDTTKLPDMKDYDIIRGKRTYQYFEDEVLYEFGYGLSYTDFEYSNLSLSSKTLDKDSTITVSFDVKNIGKVDSDEVPQMYISVKGSSVKRPIKQLKGFKRVNIKAGQTVNVSFELPFDELRFWDVTRSKYCVENTDCEIQIGASSKDIRLLDIIKVNGEIVPPRKANVRTVAENFDDCKDIYLDKGDLGYYCVCSKGNGMLVYKNMEFNENVRVFGRASSDEKGGKLTFALNTPTNEICTVDVNSGCKDFWEDFYAECGWIKGNYDLYIKMEGNVNLNHFIFATTMYFD